MDYVDKAMDFLKTGYNYAYVIAGVLIIFVTIGFLADRKKKNKIDKAVDDAAAPAEEKKDEAVSTGDVAKAEPVKVEPIGEAISPVEAPVVGVPPVTPGMEQPLPAPTPVPVVEAPVIDEMIEMPDMTPIPEITPVIEEPVVVAPVTENVPESFQGGITDQGNTSNVSLEGAVEPIPSIVPEPKPVEPAALASEVVAPVAEAAPAAEAAPVEEVKWEE